MKYDLFAKMLGGYGRRSVSPRRSVPRSSGRESGKPSLINVWIDQNAFAPGP